MFAKLIGPSLVLVIGLQLLILFQLSEHSKQAEITNDFAVDARNSIRAHLNYTEEDVSKLKMACSRSY